MEVIPVATKAVMVNSYGGLALIGFLLFAALVWFLPQRQLVFRFNEYCTFMILLVWVVLVGARVANITFYHYLAGDPSSWLVLLISRSGLSFHGGFLAGAAATWGWARLKERPFYQLADRLVVALPPIIILGRVANFLNKEIVGTETTWYLSWELGSFSPLDYHPVQLYEGLGYLLLFCGLLLLLSRQRAKFGSGFFFSCFLVGYSAVRLPAEFMKAEQYLQLGLPTGVWLSLILLVYGLVIYFKVRSSKGNN